MSKIINLVNEIGREFNRSGMAVPMIALFALPILIFSANKDGLYIYVLAAYILAVGFAVVQWDRGQYKESNGYQIGMAVFLVFTWSLIGNNNKWVPLMVGLNAGLFIMQLWLWCSAFKKEYHEAELKRITV